MRKTPDLTLYVLTDRGLSLGRSNTEVVRRALAGGATAIQYREKAAPFRSMVGEATRLALLCRDAGVPFIVNDRLDVAQEAKADGIHLGQRDLPPARARRIGGPDFIIGISVRTEEEARRAEETGADYLAANGVFPTATKTLPGEPLGLTGLARIIAATRLPVVAIGGITPGNAESVIRAGAAGVAVISAVTSCEDIEGRCREILAAVARGRAG